MRKNRTDWLHFFRSILVLVICLGCIGVVVSFTLPYESLGGGIQEKVELREEGVSPEIFQLMKVMPPSHIRATVASLAANIEDDHYVGETMLLISGPVDVVDNTIFAVIPAARVQRLFELAVARQIDIDFWGYETTPPAGHPYAAYPFYTVVRAQLVDPKVMAITIPGD